MYASVIMLLSTVSMSLYQTPDDEDDDDHDDSIDPSDLDLSKLSLRKNGKQPKSSLGPLKRPIICICNDPWGKIACE